MKIRVVGSGRSGSWIIRGEQLGQALGAEVHARSMDTYGVDITIAVKRWGLLPQFRSRESLLVWDIVDAWPQPEGNTWTRGAAMDWLRRALDIARPDVVVAATRAMQRDIEELGYRSFTIPHHYRPGSETNPIRKTFKTVGYEGAAGYLEGWIDPLMEACAKRGLDFVLNPPRLADLDCVVAFRAASGYPALNWKSNVKLANAHGTGTPFIGSPEAGYTETATGYEVFLTSPADLDRALAYLEPYDLRNATSASFLRASLPIEDVARFYLQRLENCHAARG